jgi:outer membrane protein assembly factor BamB
MKRSSGIVAAVLCTLLSAATAQAQDWPQFRGPGGQGHATATDIPLEWSETKNVAWKVPVPGKGWSSPVVAAGRVWLTSAVEERRGNRPGGPVSLRALAFDSASGRELVNVEVFRVGSPGVINFKNSHASPTPVVSGERVFVHFGAQGTAALTTAGEIIWKTRLTYDSQHGSGGSPIVYNDLLIVACDGPDDAYVVALEVATGKQRWKARRRVPFDQAYSTPLVIRVGDADQIVSAGAHRVAAYEPERGREIWHVNYPNGFSNVPRPVYGGGLVFIATGFNEPTMIAVRPDGRGNVTRTHVAWTIERGAPLTPSPLYVDGLLYFVHDLGIATCVDAQTGAVRWQQRLGGNHSASPVYAAGRIYFQSEEGETIVIAPGPEFRQLARSTLDGATLGSMAVVDGAVLIRTDSHLYRIGE